MLIHAWVQKPYTIKYLNKKSKKGINSAIQKGKIFHLWFHPFNLATAPNKLITGLEEIIDYATNMRKSGKLEIKTMGETAEEFLEE